MSTKEDFDLHALAKVISERASESPDVSYTAKLKAKGIAHIAKKLGEEASETIIAAVSQDDEALTGEVADLLYHLMVLLDQRGIAFSQIERELAARTAQSGIAEKKSRGS